jgi:hypothetical protein
MLIDLSKAIPVGDDQNPISVRELRAILKAGNARCERWKGGRRVRSVRHLRDYLVSGKAVLVPYGDFSLLLIEFILVYNIIYRVNESLTLHLYEKQRVPRRKTKPKHHEEHHVERPTPLHNIALRQRLSESIDEAEARGFYNKLRFKKNVHVIVDPAKRRELDLLVEPSPTYPGLVVVQHRVEITAEILDEAYQPIYRIRRKRGRVDSVFQWHPYSCGMAE